MPSPNLQLPDVAANQEDPQVTVNANTASLDNSENSNVQVAVTGDLDLTTDQTRNNIVIEFTGTPGAPHTADMPDTNKRKISFVNNTDDVITVRNSAEAGANQPVLQVGDSTVVHYDGTNFLQLSTAGGAATFLELTDTFGAYVAHQRIVTNAAANALISQDIPYDLGWINQGTPAVSSTVFRFTFTRSVRFPSGLTNSNGSVGTNPSSQTDFDIQRNTVSVGTIQVSSGGVLSFVMASATDFVAGDEIDVVAPGNLNGLVDLNVTLAGILRSG